jgi:hypothetical protein
MQRKAQKFKFVENYAFVCSFFMIKMVSDIEGGA